MAKLSLKIEQNALERALWPANFLTPAVVREGCKACSSYGQNWACPPFDEEDELELPYWTFFAGTLTIPEAGRGSLPPEELNRLIEDLFSALKSVLNGEMIRLEKVLPGSRAYWMGCCELCPLCTRELGRPCRRPSERRLSVEAIGLAAGTILQDLFGLPLEWAVGRLPAAFHVLTAIAYPQVQGAAILQAAGRPFLEFEFALPYTVHTD